jgi:2-polyprenyl-3-methyl-5-hydroxy-6-metoxy-1,4-benzoquinol methylase
VDVGCGGGMLRRIERSASEHGMKVKLMGIDPNPYAARAAREFTREGNGITWITEDALAYQPDERVDAVISSLFTHHLEDDSIVKFLRWMEGAAERGWFINDLHREKMSYYGFKALAWAMQWHSFVRHDARSRFCGAFRERTGRLLRRGGFEVQIEERRQARLCVSRVKT